MITPLMFILSCLTENYEVDEPISILYLSQADRDIVLSETSRLCSIITDPNCIARDTETGEVYTLQACGTNSITLNPYTAALLGRAYSCVESCRNHLILDTKMEEGHDDLTTNNTVLNIGKEPRQAYISVLKLMEDDKSLSYKVKIARLAELLNILSVYGSGHVDSSEEDRKREERLALHSSISYWKGMLMGDVMRSTHELPKEPFTKATIAVIREQLQALGLYGFVNPLKMYNDFSASRVGSKTSVNVTPDIITYLYKIVQSGGGELRFEDNY